MWHDKSTEEVERRLKTNLKIGLAELEVEKRRLEFGENKLEEKKKEN